MLRVTLTAVLLACISTSVNAQSYPNGPIRIIVAYPPGGGTDIAARALAARMSKDLGWQIVVENLGGAAGIIGTEAAAKAAPDGYTLLMGTNGTHAIFVSLYPKLPYNPIKDFTPISNVATVASVFVVHPDLPVKSVKELIALTKASPGRLNYASGGSGTNMHLAMELLKMMAEIEVEHVAYKGAAPALLDILGGRVQMMITNLPPLLSHIKAGRLRALAMADAKRSALLPDVPTISEAGVTGYKADLWWGMFGPAGMPAPIVSRLNAEIRNALEQKELKEQFASMGAEPAGTTSAEFASTIKSDIVKWTKVVEISGARVQ
ncbi:MAG: tripartite tricarboxylate transporter substrate binding protein [Betaproteobacteria bacterium]|nr:tripartite tricarboxylate transporter substrate binding protein [Betaproteobacteria bacterium]